MSLKVAKYIVVRLAFASVLPAIPQTPTAVPFVPKCTSCAQEITASSVRAQGIGIPTRLGR